MNKNKFTFIFFFILLPILVSACTSNSYKRTVKKIQNTFSPSGDSDAPAFQIKNVVRSTLDPNKTFDIVGDGSGTIGTLCLSPPDDDGVTPNESACSCKFDFIKRDGSNEAFEVPVSYFEPNLLRCSFVGVPVDVPFVNVSVHVTDSDGYSNEITFPLHGAGTSGDPTSAFNFLPVQRFMCKDAVVIPNIMDASGGNPNPVYDPFLSESPEISYGLNFFATNLGGALSQFVTKVIPVQGLGWICPNDPSKDLDGTDKRVFSLGPDKNNSRLMLSDRTSFYLAKAPVGIFTIPFNTFIAPGVFTQEGNRKNPDPNNPTPIGFGAPPFRMSDKEEVCPDSTAIIPNGMKWMKVWQFRSTLEARTFKKSPLLGAIGIFCNPGLFPDGSPIVLSCNSGNISERLDSVTRCFSITPGGADLNGTDQWSLKGSSVNCSQIGDDPLSICPDLTPRTITPQNNKVIIGNIDNASRFDLMYVVTPPELMTIDFQQQNAKALPYMPYRFYSADHCLSTSGVESINNGKKDCEVQKRVPYGLVTHDASQVDPSTGQPPLFPMCVLQPK